MNELSSAIPERRRRGPLQEIIIEIYWKASQPKEQHRKPH